MASINDSAMPYLFGTSLKVRDETMRRCIQLPSQHTLRDYTHYTKAQPGFSAEIDAQLCAAKIHQCEEK